MMYEKDSVVTKNEHLKKVGQLHIPWRTDLLDLCLQCIYKYFYSQYMKNCGWRYIALLCIQ